MKVKKAIKKIVALGLGATMLGATLFGAAATSDLKDFPSQFIVDGEFDGLFVVGAEAAAADIIGITDIAMAVQSKAVKKVCVESTTSETTFTSDDGVYLVTGSDQLFVGEAAPEDVDKVDDDDFSDLLAEGTVEDTDYEDDEYDYKQYVEFDPLTVAFGPSIDDDTDGMPVVSLDLTSADAFTYTVEFLDDLHLAASNDEDDDEAGLQNSEDIELLGETYTFKSGIDADDDIVLYKSSETKLLQLGEQVEVQDGKYVVEVVAVNSDD